MKPLLVVPVSVSNMADLPAALQRAEKAGAEAIEWRVDALHSYDDADLAAVPHNLSVPLWATCRTRAEGGAFDGDYGAMIERLLQVDTIEAIDVEIARGGDLVRRVEDSDRHCIASFHSFTHIPADSELEAVLNEMEGAGASVRKIAVMPHSVAEALAFAEFVVKRGGNESLPLIAIAMGEHGIVTRLLAGQLGSYATFASVDAESAPGQWPIDLMRKIRDRVNSQ